MVKAPVGVFQSESFFGGGKLRGKAVGEGLGQSFLKNFVMLLIG